MALKLQYQTPLAPLTTMGVGGKASHFVHVENSTQLTEAFAYARNNNLPVYILGGGSNVVVPDQGVNALVLHPGFSEITLEEDEEGVLLACGAGVMLDQLVEKTVREGLWGIENLSGIPGSVGATPIQNVGAYGVEVKDVITEVTVYDPRQDLIRVLTNSECGFGYRDSFFKSVEGKQLVITSVTMKLSKIPSPKIGYKDLAAYFEGKQNISQEDIREAVIHIRKGKFPDWHITGTAGSFFKNPIISETEYQRLLAQYPELPGFPHNGEIKIALGWVLDKILNLRGFREGSVGLYDKQALVLVNYGGATSEEIFSFSESIIQKIFDATNICVEREAVMFK